ncbi:MAG: AAA family ATPase [Solirubrobacteraceae bacterium]
MSAAEPPPDTPTTDAGDPLLANISSYRESTGRPPIDFVAKLAELRAQKAASKGLAANPQLGTFADFVPDMNTSSISLSAAKVSEACDSIDVFEVYERLSKGQYDPREKAVNKTETHISCPIPGHIDAHPSAWVNKDTGLWMCGRCNQGGDKYTIAGYHYGLNPKTDFFEIKKRMVYDLRGVTYETPVVRPGSSTPSPAETTPGQTEDEPTDDPWRRAVEERKNKRLIELHGDHAAVQEWKSGQFTPPTFIDDLEAELNEPEPDVEWTINGLHAVGFNTTITAGFKVGKTTLMMNLTRALADQEPFLGRHDVRALDGRIAYLNYEVDQVRMKRSFREMGIKKAANIWHVALRGQPLNLMDDAAFEWTLAEMKRQEIEVLILDPWSGCYFGDENDNSQINAFTKRLDEFKRLAGIKDLFIPIHTGRYVEEGNERARGGAKVDDWTDSRWVLSKNAADNARWFRAEGRGISIETSEMKYDEASRLFVYSGFNGTKDQKTAKTLRDKVYEYIRANPGCSGKAMEDNIVGNGPEIRSAARALIASNDVVTRKGKYNATLHYEQGTAPVPGVL